MTEQPSSARVGVLRRFWLELVLVPTLFLLGSAVVRQVVRARSGLTASGWQSAVREAMVAGERGAKADGLRRLNAAAEQAPLTPDVQTQLAAAFERLGDRDAALKHLERSMRAGPKGQIPLESLLSLVQTYVDRSRLDDGSRVLEEMVLPRWPNSAESHYLRGLIAYLRRPGADGPAAADPEFRTALKLNPKLVDARYYLGLVNIREGKLQEAVQQLKQVTAEAPHLAGAWQGLARAHRRLGDSRAAAAALRRFSDLDTAARDAAHLRTRVSLKRAPPAEYLQLGRLDLLTGASLEAVGILSHYVDLQPTDPAGHRELATAMRKVGRPTEARREEALERALAGRK